MTVLPHSKKFVYEPLPHALNPFEVKFHRSEIFQMCADPLCLGP